MRLEVLVEGSKDRGKGKSCSPQEIFPFICLGELLYYHFIPFPQQVKPFVDHMRSCGLIVNANRTARYSDYEQKGNLLSFFGTTFHIMKKIVTLLTILIHLLTKLIHSYI